MLAYTIVAASELVFQVVFPVLPHFLVVNVPCQFPLIGQMTDRYSRMTTWTMSKVKM